MPLAINFYPESDLEDFAPSVSEYERIWNEDGERIIRALESHAGLQFRETVINAVVGDGISHSHPLFLRYSLSSADKRVTLVHELGHRLLYKRVPGMGTVSSLGHHKYLFLILGDVLGALYGKEYLAQTIARDNALAPKYKEAWAWANAFTETERQARFQRILAGNLTLLDLSEE